MTNQYLLTIQRNVRHFASNVYHIGTEYPGTLGLILIIIQLMIWLLFKLGKVIKKDDYDDEE